MTKKKITGMAYLMSIGSSCSATGGAAALKCENYLRTDIKYIDYPVKCHTCGVNYIPNETEAKEALNIPPILANNYCSRKCYDNVYIKPQHATNKPA